ncbi:MAG TPA: TetR/AcrR family transcriptional regulator [Pseudolysinimonas sp.]|nr:TetR/AcrR family transcriptional regulator [Pseudolysinimonas sp.]
MPKIIDHDQRRRDIVQVAKKLILHGGFEAATMRSIASEAGFANGALKHYFPGKDSIVAATFQQVLEEMYGSQPPAPEGASAVDELRLYLEASLPLDQHRITSGRVLLALWEYAMSNAELAELYRGHLENWKSQLIEILGRARRERTVRTKDTDEQIANEIISVTIGSAVMSLMYPGGDRIPDYRSYIDVLLRRLAASG